MSSYSAIAFAKPLDWQDFERKARVLFSCVLEDPLVVTNGRSGQRQHGVDLYGRRSGDGSLVGIQCKGKTGGFGRKITPKELQAEFKNTEEFKPALDEFVLITTAEDDAKIQEEARLLESAANAAGRKVRVAVWGWGQLQQHIAQHAPAIRAFSPDASPFADEQLEISKLTLDRTQAALSDIGEIKALILDRLTVVPADTTFSRTVGHLDSEIDEYRALIQAGKARTAVDLLLSLRARVWDSAPGRIKFRIVANIGAAKHRLGRLLEAASDFLEAFTYDDTPIAATTNRIAALIIRGESEAAHIAAVAAITKYPDDVDVGIQRLQAKGESETASEIWGGLLPTVRASAKAHALYISMLRAERREEWRQEAFNAATTHPDNLEIKRLAAEATVQGILELDPFLLGSLTPVDHERLADAASTLTRIWNESLLLEIPPDVSAGHNAALANLALRNTEAAASIADSVVTHEHTEETQALRITISLKQGRLNDALSLVQRLTPGPSRDLKLAELLIEKDPKRAREAAAELLRATTDPVLVLGASNVVAETFIQERQWQSAIDTAKGITATHPEHPLGPLLEHRIYRDQGSPEADYALSVAKNRLTSAAEFQSRLIVAQALEEGDRHDDAVEALHGHVDETRDSPALRCLLVAAFNSDRRATVGSVLGRLSASTLQSRFFQRLSIALSLRTGDLNEAERHLRAFMAREPNNLEMFLRYIRLLLKQLREGEATELLRRPPDGLTGTAEEKVQLAFLLAIYGDAEHACTLMYETWLGNPTNSTVNLRFVGFFLGPRTPINREAASDAVTVNSAFGLKSEIEQRKFVIEPEEPLRRLPHMVAPDHPIARAAIGKKVGESLTLQGSQYTIDWIKPKEIDVLHGIMESFNLYFPDNDGLQMVPLGDEETDKFKNIRLRVQARHDAIQRALDLYGKQLIPLSITAEALGSDAVETLLGLIGSGRRFRVCEGSAAERKAALDAIRQNQRRGCVVDFVTFYLIRRLKLEDVVRDVCGPIGMVQHTVDQLLDKRDEVRGSVDEPDTSLTVRNGELVRIETPALRKAEALGLIEGDLRWISENADVLAAKGGTDLPSDLRGMMRKVGVGFAEEYWAAHGNSRILLSEDMGFRVLAGTAMALPGTWLQPVLMTARDVGTLSHERYSNAVVELIRSGAQFMSVDADLIWSTIKDAKDVPLPDGLTTVLAALAEPNVQVESQVSVVLHSLTRIWCKNGLPHLAKSAATSALLSTFLVKQWDQLAPIAKILWNEGQARIPHWEQFANHLHGWLKGHFVPLPTTDRDPS